MRVIDLLQLTLDSISEVTEESTVFIKVEILQTVQDNYYISLTQELIVKKKIIDVAEAIWKKILNFRMNIEK